MFFGVFLCSLAVKFFLFGDIKQSTIRAQFSTKRFFKLENRITLVDKNHRIAHNLK